MSYEVDDRLAGLEQLVLLVQLGRVSYGFQIRGAIAVPLGA